MTTLNRLLFSLALCAFSALGMAQQFSGIFRPSDAKMEYIEGLVWEEFLTESQRLSAEGYRLTNLETSGQGKRRLFWGIYTESVLRDTIIRTNSWKSFVKAKRAMAADSFILNNVQAYAISEVDAHFIGVWYKPDDITPHKIWKVDSPESLMQRTHQMADRQYYIQEIEVFLTPSGRAQYLAIYHYSALPVRNYVSVEHDLRSFKKDLWQRQQSSYRLVDYEQFSAKEDSYFIGLYHPGRYTSKVSLDQTHTDFNGTWEQFEKEDLMLISWEIRD